MDTTQRAETGNLRLDAALFKQRHHAVLETLTQRLQVRVGLRGERLERRDACHHRHRVGAEGAAMLDFWGAVGGVVHGHDVFTAGDGANREATADDLAERGYIRVDAVAALRTVIAEAEGD